MSCNGPTPARGGWWCAPLVFLTLANPQSKRALLSPLTGPGAGRSRGRAPGATARFSSWSRWWRPRSSPPRPSTSTLSNRTTRTRFSTFSTLPSTWSLGNSRRRASTAPRTARLAALRGGELCVREGVLENEVPMPRWVAHSDARIAANRGRYRCSAPCQSRVVFAKLFGPT